MKNLWTPWRMSYIQGAKNKEQGCIFEAGPGKTHEKAGLVLYRSKSVVVLLNRYPYANGHLLVAPARHIADIGDLLPEETSALFDMLRESVTILRKHLKPDGFNVGLNLGTVAGAGHPDHLHFHIVPRWEGDHNFMTVLADVRTIPEHIENTFDQLLPDFQMLLTK
jgi:ATP adenylyltransferase